jgi:hypothetical protein
MERAWMLVSIVGVVTAAILLLREYRDTAIVAGALGAVAWFLSYRVKLRKTIIETTEATETEGDDSEDQDDE